MQTKKILSISGLAVVFGLVLFSLFAGYFWIIFYLLGLFVILNFISLLCRTNSISSFILDGGLSLYIIGIMGGLYLLYLTLKFIFIKSFLWELLLLMFGFGLPFAASLVFVVLIELGYHFYWMLGDSEKRLSKNPYIYIPY
jgi:hypothetical protein